MLLQRTRARQVVPVYAEFLEKYPTAEFLARESPHRLLDVIGALGLRWRAPLMIRMAGVVAERGGPPDELEELTNLPGVGPYAAAAYRSLHRNRRAVIVDANVVRWLGRVFGFRTHAETRRASWLSELADRLTPARAFRAYNYAVLDLAMQVCVSKPRCAACPLGDGICRYATADTRQPTSTSVKDS